MSNSYRSRFLPELPGAGRLGRHVGHDSRSRRYAYDTAGLTDTAVRHTRNVPVFDQGDLGSCTGNAAVGCVATDPLFGQLSGHPDLSETLAVQTYSIATTLDDDPDHYPPDDTGSTGLAAAKALQKQGLITGYQHVFTFADFRKALSIGPVMFGLTWYDSFDNPDAEGLVKISRGATVRGGHEIYADENDVSTKRIGFTNSWGAGWGLKGRLYMSYATVETLQADQGDVTVPLPSGAPVPAPAPVVGPSGPSGPTGPSAPTPDPDDVELLASMQRWAKAKGLT